ncbi:AAA family ATPase [Kitasatospora sp. MBT63]|uniref:AAA family ATPase n=1 Tax=Kitasatospora sp. MBT63 TaxID=1444768 RepID=UPI00068CA299|nr:AAA family ATPase [Kitasatospora sp. MBT63]
MSTTSSSGHSHQVEHGPGAGSAGTATFDSGHQVPEGQVLGLVRAGDAVVMIGASGSGKSWLLAGVQDQVVGLDRLRALISAAGDQSATPDAILLQHQLLTMRLSRGRTTYIDNVSSRSHHRMHLVDLAHAHGRRAVALWVDTPVETSLQRNALRPDHLRVPEAVLREQHREIGVAAELLELLRVEGFDEILHHRGT